mgnify:CR=1 FL=1
MAKVENLTVQYGGTAVLENFSAEFPDGGVAAVSGRSGCGKTTLLAVRMAIFFIIKKHLRFPAIIA